MELRQLRYFVQAAQDRSISKAAQALHIVQPALTAQIKALEEELGVRLLDRSPMGVSLTPAGAKVLKQANDILARVGRLLQDARGHPAGAQSRVVRVGIPNAMTGAFAGQLIQAARQELGVAVEIVESMSGFLLEWLKSQRIDVGLLFAGQAARGLDTRPLLQEALHLAGPPGALRVRRPVEMGDLGSYPLILPSARHGLGKLVRMHAREHGVRLNIQTTVDSVTEIKHLVELGQGYSVLAPLAMQAELARRALSSAPIRNPGMPRILVTATLKKLDPQSAAAQVRDLIHKLDMQPPRLRAA
jgi:DNA-binding transcriptional LysR family regulator